MRCTVAPGVVGVARGTTVTVFRPGFQDFEQAKLGREGSCGNLQGELDSAGTAAGGIDDRDQKVVVAAMQAKLLLEGYAEPGDGLHLGRGEGEGDALGPAIDDRAVAIEGERRRRRSGSVAPDCRPDRR